MNKTYTTIKSIGILLLYWGILAFLLIMLIGVPFFARDDMKSNERLLFYIVFTLLFIWFCWIIFKVYNMNYELVNDRLIIHGAFNTNTIHIHNIEEIKLSAIPFGIRLFGGSFVGGRYYLPGIGKAWVAMTNFKDGVLITTRDQENYVITPANPKQFIEDINKLISK